MSSSWDVVVFIVWGAGFSPGPPPRDCLGHMKGWPFGVASVVRAKGGGEPGTLSVVEGGRMVGKASSAAGGGLTGVVLVAM